MPRTATAPLTRPARARGAAAVAVAVALTLGACGGEDPTAPHLETDVPDVRGEEDLADPYTGDYDERFYEDVTAYTDQEVTLSAEVETVLSPRTFTIVGPDGEEVPPLLVVATEEVSGLEAGLPVVVAATPEEDFRLTTVEEELGTDLTDEDYAEFEDEPYLWASTVETSPQTSG